MNVGIHEFFTLGRGSKMFKFLLCLGFYVMGKALTGELSCYWSCWLVGCFGFNGPLRQYFSLYRAVSQREGERGEKG